MGGCSRVPMPGRQSLGAFEWMPVSVDRCLWLRTNSREPVAGRLWLSRYG